MYLVTVRVMLTHNDLWLLYPAIGQQYNDLAATSTYLCILLGRCPIKLCKAQFNLYVF